MQKFINQYIKLFIGFSLFYLFSFVMAEENIEKPQSFYSYSAEDINGESIEMRSFKGKKILIVNVASRCGFTPQYKDLQKLYETYQDRLVVLGFPSNNFLWQEPGTNNQIHLFCKREYGVTFPMFSKINVKGKEIHPIFKWLSDSKLNGSNDKEPSWNFNKYLIDEQGNLLKVYGSRVDPMDISITKYLSAEIIDSLP